MFLKSNKKASIQIFNEFPDTLLTKIKLLMVFDLEKCLFKFSFLLEFIISEKRLSGYLGIRIINELKWLLGYWEIQLICELK